ncbi:DUF2029 domain-containing protein, partial [Candidatus Microgenomates bacterium]|nr:DUF2029 domain-containing protein [Candidatus Microgenomates bacterium]
MNTIKKDMPLSRENKIKIVSLIILTGFILAAVFACYQRYFLGRGYPYSTFLFRPGDRFMDFYNWVNNSKNLNPYLATDVNPVRNVSPFLYLSGYLLTIIDRQVAFILLTIIFVGLFVHINIQNLKMEKTALFLKVFVVSVFSFLSYPFIFLADRGNVDGLIFIILYFFLHYYKKNKATVSSILLAIAIAWKIVPAVFIVLFIADKRYKEGIISIVTAVILTIFSLSIFQGGMINNAVR